jgi:mono/diheme cytochrome c family protein
MGRAVGWAAAGLAAVFIALQLVPYGRAHTNPPKRLEPAWDSPATRRLAVRACFDCHSNETVWPWYAGIAPVSWLIRRDVDEGRRKLNFSEWDRPQEEARESAKAVRKGTMPPWLYALVQPRARLTPAETEALLRGLEVTLGAGDGRRGSGREDEG